MRRQKLIISTIILITSILIVIELNNQTPLLIRKYNVSMNNAVMNITPEELSKYPALEKAIDCANKKEYSPSKLVPDQRPFEPLCKVSTNDWMIIRDFIESKYKNSSYDDGDVSPCIKFGEKYGQTCYQFIFIKSG